MKALTYHGPHHVSVDTMPDPALEAADDIILRVTATAICGSDLHLYRGKIPGTHHGDIFGHEFMGKWWKPVPRSPRSAKATGWLSRLSSPAETASFVACSSMPPAKAPIAAEGATLNRKGISPPAALFGYSDLYGGIPGRPGRNMYGSPKPIPDRLKCQTPYPMKRCCFCQIFCPPPRQAVKNAEVKPGSSVAIFGAGPVGLLCASCAEAQWRRTDIYHRS